MSAAELRLDIIERMLRLSDVTSLVELRKLLLSFDARNKVPTEYLVDGKKLSEAEYINFLKESEAEIENGEFITLDDLIEESKEW